jgi:integrase
MGKTYPMRLVARGIWKDAAGAYWQRLAIRGRRTWRRVYARTDKSAIEQVAARISDHARSKLQLAVDPYERLATVGDCLEAYKKAGFPDRWGRQRAPRTLQDEEKRWQRLLDSFGKHSIKSLTAAVIQRWAADRDAARAAELDVYSLRNALRFGHSTGLIKSNPLDGVTVRLRRASEARHCRDMMPESAAALHQVAAELFRRRDSAAIGWQLLIQSMTGLRTSEALALRMSGPVHGPGFVENDWLWVRRSKGGVNPFVAIHPALRACLDAHAMWHRTTWPDSPWYFPGQVGHLNTNAAAHALRRLCPKMKIRPFTPHGCRAFFVTMRRSQGIPDAQVAAEIGDRTGASIITSTYGAIPPNWQGKAGLSWLPPGCPAWGTLRGTVSEQA